MSPHHPPPSWDTTTSTASSTTNPPKVRRILSLALVTYLALSFSTTTTAKPTHVSNNHRNQQQSPSILNRLSSSWSSLTTPLNSLHAISGSPKPANHASLSSKKTLQKRNINGDNSNNKDAHKKKAGKATSRAKHTYSAYEAIVNSDSQMPVFLNQHHLKSKGKASSGNGGGGKGKGKPSSPTTQLTGVKKAGMVTPIDILRQTGTKKPAAAAVVTSAPIRVLSAEEEKKERENERKAKEKLEGTSPAPKKKEEGTTPAKEPSQSKSRNNGNNNKTSASRARDVVSVAAAAAAAEDGTSTTKTLFDTIFANDLQQPSRRGVDSNSSTSSNERKEDSADINAVKETINAAAHAAVAAAASNHRLEGRDAAGALKQALENIAHRIEEAATAAIALEIPSLSDHTLGSPSSSSVSDDKKIPKPVAMTENHKDTIIDDEGAVDLPAVTNTNIDTPERVVMRENHKDTIIDDEGAVDLPAVTNNNHDSDASTSGPKQPRVIIVNDNEYASDNDNPYAFTYPTYSDPKASSEYSDALDDWRLPDEDDYMAQYVHRNPQNFPGSESILFTGTVLQRTLISSALLLIGFLVLLGVISYKMYARRKNTSPWAFLHYMTFGIFSAPFYDSATISNSTLNAYTTLTDDQAFPSLASKSSSSTTKKGSWLRRGSLTRSSTSTSTGSNNNIMFSSEKKPLLPEPVVASSSSASSSFRKSGPLRTELRRTSTAQHHQMQIELALQQRQQQQTQGNSFASQHQQAEQEYLQKSFMRRTSI